MNKSNKKIFSILRIILPIILIGLIACVFPDEKSDEKIFDKVSKTDTISDSLRIIQFYDSLFEANPKFISDGFDFPVGPPDAKKYYNAQKFGVNMHLGEDWNGGKGGNSDLHDPIYSISNGYINSVENVGSGWGNVVRIVHQLQDITKIKYVESVYSHFDSVMVKQGGFVKRGVQIGTMGNCDGIYYAHLHFELRNDVTMLLGYGYSGDITGFLNPTEFINKNRPK